MRNPDASRKGYLNVSDLLPPELQPEYLIYNVFDGDVDAYNSAAKKATALAKQQSRGNGKLFVIYYSQIIKDEISRRQRLSAEKQKFDQRKAAEQRQQAAKQVNIPPPQTSRISSLPTPSPSSMYPEMSPQQTAAIKESVTRYKQAPNYSEVAAQIVGAFNPITGELMPGYSVGQDSAGNITTVSKGADNVLWRQGVGRIYSDEQKRILDSSRTNMPPAWS